MHVAQLLKVFGYYTYAVPVDHFRNTWRVAHDG